MAQEADRLKFGLGEIDAVDPRPGEDDALVDDIRRLSELDALREAAQTARSALSGALDEAADADPASAAHEVGHAKSALEATDDTALRSLGERLAEASAVISDVSTELSHYLSELPSDASTLETKLARQGELRVLTRKYAADIDGVLAWARESRDRLVAAGRLRGDARRPGAQGGRARSRTGRALQPNSARRAPRRPRASPRR